MGGSGNSGSGASGGLGGREEPPPVKIVMYIKPEDLDFMSFLASNFGYDMEQVFTIVVGRGCESIMGELETIAAKTGTSRSKAN